MTSKTAVQISHFERWGLFHLLIRCVVLGFRCVLAFHRVCFVCTWCNVMWCPPFFFRSLVFSSHFKFMEANQITQTCCIRPFLCGVAIAASDAGVYILRYWSCVFTGRLVFRCVRYCVCDIETKRNQNNSYTICLRVSEWMCLGFQPESLVDDATVEKVKRESVNRTDTT